MSGKPPWAPSTGLVAGYFGLAAATAVAVLTGGPQRPGVALALLAVAAFAISTRTRWWVAVATGLIAWLFYDGFIAGRHAELAWHGALDVQRMCVLAGVAVCGAAAAWLHRRLAGWTARRPLTFPRKRPAQLRQAAARPLALLAPRDARRGLAP